MSWDRLTKKWQAYYYDADGKLLWTPPGDLVLRRVYDDLSRCSLINSQVCKTIRAADGALLHPADRGGALSWSPRKLQGPLTEPQSVAVIQDTLRRGVDCTPAGPRTLAVRCHPCSLDQR